MSDPLTGSVEFSLICQTAIQQLVCLKLDRKKIGKKNIYEEAEHVVTVKQ